MKLWHWQWCHLQRSVDLLSLEYLSIYLFIVCKWVWRSRRCCLHRLELWKHCSMRWRSVLRFESCWWQMVEMAACLKWFHNTSSMPFGHTLNQCGSMAWWSQHEINEWNDAAIERWAADGMIRSSQQWMKQNESWRNHFIRHSSAVEPRSAHW